MLEISLPVNIVTLQLFQQFIAGKVQDTIVLGAKVNQEGQVSISLVLLVPSTGLTSAEEAERFFSVADGAQVRLCQLLAEVVNGLQKYTHVLYYTIGSLFTSIKNDENNKYLAFKMKGLDPW